MRAVMRGLYADLEEVDENVKVLLRMGVQIDSQDDNGKMALMHAAEWSRPETVRFLFRKDADGDNKDKRGRTALEWNRLHEHELPQEVWETKKESNEGGRGRGVAIQRRAVD